MYAKTCAHQKRKIRINLSFHDNSMTLAVHARMPLVGRTFVSPRRALRSVLFPAPVSPTVTTEHPGIFILVASSTICVGVFGVFSIAFSMTTDLTHLLGHQFGDSSQVGEQDLSRKDLCRLSCTHWILCSRLDHKAQHSARVGCVVYCMKGFLMRTLCTNLKRL